MNLIYFIKNGFVQHSVVAIMCVPEPCINRRYHHHTHNTVSRPLCSLKPCQMDRLLITHTQGKVIFFIVFATLSSHIRNNASPSSYIFPKPSHMFTTAVEQMRVLCVRGSSWWWSLDFILGLADDRWVGYTSLYTRESCIPPCSQFPVASSESHPKRHSTHRATWVLPGPAKWTSIVDYSVVDDRLCVMIERSLLVRIAPLEYCVSIN